MIDFVFRPLEATTYVIDLPINMDDGSSMLVTFIGKGMRNNTVVRILNLLLIVHFRSRLRMALSRNDCWRLHRTMFRLAASLRPSSTLAACPRIA
jgi:hypothetical protein